MSRDLNTMSDADRERMCTLTPYRTAIKPEWIDSNQHVAVPYYHVIMNDAAWYASESWDYGVHYRERTQKSSFILEMHLRYLRELKLGDTVLAFVRINGLDEKRMLIYYEIFHEGEGYLAATGEALGISVDMQTRRVVPFDTELHQRLSLVFDAHRQITPAPQTSILRLGPNGLERAALS